MSDEVTYGIFIILSLALLVGWFLLVKKIHNKTHLPSEQLFLLAMGLLFIVGLLIWKSSDKLETWQNGPTPEVEDKIHNYTLSIYKPLVQSRKRVAAEIRDMNILLDDIDELVNDHPRHANLLLEVKQIWSKGVFALKKLQKETDKEVRHAWIAHDTMNQKTVDAKFSKEAVILDKNINIELDTFQKLILKVHEMIRKDLAGIQKQLTKKTPRSNELSRNTLNFSTDTSEKLLRFSKTIDPAAHAQLEKLVDEIGITEQRQEKVKNHLADNPDLAGPLNQVIEAWKAAEQNNRYHFDQLLYALESALLGRKLGLDKKDYAIVSMNNTLKSHIPAIISEIQQKRSAIDNSY